MTAQPAPQSDPTNIPDDLDPVPEDWREGAGLDRNDWPFGEYPPDHPGWKALLHDAMADATADEIRRDRDAEIADAARAFRAIDRGWMYTDKWWDALYRLRDAIDRADGAA